MELMITCPNCEAQEAIYLAGNYAIYDCEGCGETTEIDVDALVELETQATPTEILQPA